MKERKSILVSEDTHARLVAAIALIVAASDCGSAVKGEVRPEAINPAFRGLSFDQFINQLLDDRDDKRLRTAASRKRRREAKRRERERSENDGGAQ